MTIMFNSHTRGYEWLSNFSAHPIVYGEHGVWPTVEHAYQAAKTTNAPRREMIRAASTPAIAKRLGKGVTLVSCWETRKVLVMSELLHCKFEQHLDLRHALTHTREPLLHLAPWDKFWGVDSEGNGENKLGELLMRLRTELTLAGGYVNV